MIIKDPKRLALRMMILCVIIGLTALAVAVMDIFLKLQVIHAEIYHCRHYGHRCHHADLEL